MGSHGLASIEFFDGTQPSGSHAGVSISFMDGLGAGTLLPGKVSGLGDLRCISQACISDVSLIQDNLPNPLFDTGLLVDNSLQGTVNSMSEDISFEELNAELLCSLPQVKQALNGDMDGPQVSQLIAELQSHLLELNAVSQELFGDFSAELNSAILEAESGSTDSLLTLIDQDGNLFADPATSHNLPGTGNEATLDGLFTAPEAFPLTLDFSNQHGIQEASELFAATSGSGSSISSTAHSDSSDGLVGSAGTSPDFS